MDWKDMRKLTESTRHLASDKPKLVLRVWNVSAPRDVLIKELVRSDITALEVFLSLSMRCPGDDLVLLEEYRLCCWQHYMARVTPTEVSQ
jgi:hypothetical protein